MKLQLTYSPGWNPTNARELARLASDAYSREDWYAGMAGARNYLVVCAKTQSFGIIMDCGNCIAVAFRGTANPENLLLDAECFRRPLNMKTPLHGVKVHAGFLEGYNSVSDQMMHVLQSINGGTRPIFITGHSYGGALAVLAGLDLQLEGFNVHSVYTFGQPRVGNGAFSGLVERTLGDRLQRVVYDNDIVARVPHLPSLTDPYRHAGVEVLLPENHRPVLNPSSGRRLWLEARSAWRALVVRHSGIFEDALSDHHIRNYVRRLS